MLFKGSQCGVSVRDRDVAYVLISGVRVEMLRGC